MTKKKKFSPLCYWPFIVHWGDDHLLEHFYYDDSGFYGGRRLKQEIMTWIDETLPGRVGMRDCSIDIGQTGDIDKHRYIMLQFHDEDDILLFKLTWCGNISQPNFV